MRPLMTPAMPQLAPGRKTEAIDTILQSHPDADLFVIVLGDNHFGDAAGLAPQMKTLLTPILQASRACVWVTPTLGAKKFANKSKLINTIKVAVNNIRSSDGKTCSLIDSYVFGGPVVNDESA